MGMSFKEILEEYDVPIAPSSHHHSTRGWIQFDCPWCGKESQSYHMGYNIGNGYANCWRCGMHDLIGTLQELLNITYGKAKKLVKGIDGVREETEPEKKKQLILPPNITRLQTAHKNYLRERGYNYKKLERLWGIQGIGMSSRLSWSVFIPIIHQGKTVSWITRAIGSKRVRYIGAGEDEELVSKKDVLYGGDYARRAIIIVEGTFDVWRIGPGAVATFGTAVTNKQILEMVKHEKRYVCFDKEKEAQVRAKKLIEKLAVFPGNTYNITLDSKDADESSKEDIKTLRGLL